MLERKAVFGINLGTLSRNHFNVPGKDTRGLVNP